AGCGHVVPDDLELGHEPLDADRKGLGLRRRREDEREEKLTPREREDNRRRREKARGGEWQEHATERGPAVGPIDEGRLLQLYRNLSQEALQHPDGKRQVEQRAAADQRERLVVDLQRAHD